MHTQSTQSQSSTQPSFSTKSKREEMTHTSNVNSCLLKESCIIRCPIGTVWEAFKSFQFEKLSPSLITSTQINSGNPCQVGCTYQVKYKDGSVVTYMIVEISELKRSISFEMIECEPKQNFSSMLTTIRFCKVTMDDSTYFSWEGKFSNDVTNDMIQSKRDKVHHLFKDMVSYFEKGEKKF